MLSNLVISVSWNFCVVWTRSFEFHAMHTCLGAVAKGGRCRPDRRPQVQTAVAAQATRRHLLPQEQNKDVHIYSSTGTAITPVFVAETKFQWQQRLQHMWKMHRFIFIYFFHFALWALARLRRDYLNLGPPPPPFYLSHSLSRRCDVSENAPIRMPKVAWGLRKLFPIGFPNFRDATSFSILLLER